ncbi:MAG: hypothetical protein JWN90_619 [Parcubacteria group bacterium]|nr:hypothetical protein [Parcubacteria group bacterium]
MRAIQLSKGILEKLYIDKELSLREIAKKLQCDPGVISRALKRFEIPVRYPTAPRLFTKELLAALYLKEGLSTYAIAARYACDAKTIYRHLKLNGITPRSIEKITLTKEDLQYLYIHEKKSLKDIGDEFGYSAAGILKKCREFGIKRRAISETSTKHAKYDFAGSNEDKAYIIGFRLGDLGIRKMKNLVYVSSGTTKDAQVTLIRELFSPYGPVWVGNKSKTGAVNVSCSLNGSFSFLLPKHKNIPKWILQSSASFYSFLAGYADAEGNFGIQDGRARFRIRSYDVEILEDLHEGLNRLGVENTFGLESKAGISPGGSKRNEDCWRLAVAKAPSLHLMLTTLLPLLRHQKRYGDAKQAMENVAQRLA